MASVEIVAAGGGVQPQLAVLPGGEIEVVFGRGEEIFCTSSPDGKSFGRPVVVGKLEKLALGRRRGPRIAATDKLLTVTAISHKEGALHSWTSTDRGKTWSTAETLNTVENSAREGLHAMAGDGKGTVAVAWLDLRSGGMELWSRVSPDGGRNWHPEARVYASPDGHICECCHPGVAIGPHGQIAAMWRNWLDGSRDLWTAASTDGGKSFAPARKVGSGTWKINACPMDGGSVTFLPDGTLSSVWRRENIVVAASGNGDSEKALMPMAAQPVIAQTSAGPPMYAWEQGGEVHVLTSGRPRRVSAGRFPSLVALPSGDGAFLAWEEDAGAIRGELISGK